MNNVWEKLETRVSPAEYDLLKNIPKGEFLYLNKTFGNVTNNMMEFYVGKKTDLQYIRPTIVQGVHEQLLKVKCYFYLKMANLTRFTKYSLSQIVSLNQDEDKDPPPFTTTPGLAVLYLDKNINDYGKFEHWNESCILSKITERSRNGLITLVLTEIDLKERLKITNECRYFNITDSALPSDITSKARNKTETWEA